MRESRLPLGSNASSLRYRRVFVISARRATRRGRHNLVEKHDSVSEIFALLCLDVRQQTAIPKAGRHRRRYREHAPFLPPPQLPPADAIHGVPLLQLREHGATTIYRLCNVFVGFYSPRCVVRCLQDMRPSGGAIPESGDDDYTR